MNIYYLLQALNRSGFLLKRLQQNTTTYHFGPDRFIFHIHLHVPLNQPESDCRKHC